MRPKVHTFAPTRLNELTAGRFSVVEDAEGIALVDAQSSETIRLVEFSNSPDKHSKKIEVLSRRERDVLRMLADGVGIRQIAERMKISIKTAETYRGRIKQKLALESGTHLLMFAVEWKIRCADAPSAAN